VDRNPAVVTMAEFGVYQPGMAALSVRTQQRSFNSLNQYAGGRAGGLDLVGLGVAVVAVVVVFHYLGRGRK